MHQSIFYLAVVWMSALFSIVVFRALQVRSSAERILAFDLAVLLAVGLLVLFSDAEGVPYFLDAALALALLSFAATIAAARFVERGRPLR